MSLVCVSVDSRGKECVSTIQLFEDYYNEINSNKTINLVSFVSDNNRILSIQISKLTLLTNPDKDIDILINTRMTYYFVAQFITKNETKLELNPQNITFLEAIDYMTNAYLIMSSNIEFSNNIVYIIDQSSLRTKTPFNHIRAEKELTEYQKNYYFLILNYQIFLQKLSDVNLNLAIKSNIKKEIYISIAQFYCVLNFILYLSLHIFLFFYVYRYYKMLADLLNRTEKKMNLKNNNISVRDMIAQKIIKLKTIILLYNQDLYPAIVDLNFI